MVFISQTRSRLFGHLFTTRRKPCPGFDLGSFIDPLLQVVSCILYQHGRCRQSVGKYGMSDVSSRRVGSPSKQWYHFDEVTLLSMNTRFVMEQQTILLYELR